MSKLKVKKVIIFKHGVSYFILEGKQKGSGTFELEFEVSFFTVGVTFAAVICVGQQDCFAVVQFQCHGYTAHIHNCFDWES